MFRVVFGLMAAVLVSVVLSQAPAAAQQADFGFGYGGFPDYGRYGGLRGYGGYGDYDGFGRRFDGRLFGSGIPGRSYNNYWSGYDGGYGGTVQYPDDYGLDGFY